jgi:twitching motility two-component system response regulator PilH
MAKKVMVVDDSQTEAANMRSILSDVGCIVITASNGKEALAKAKLEKPAVVFLDGYETCRMLQEDSATKHIPVVFVTSKGGKTDVVWGQMQGGKGHVTKPYKAEQIIDQLKAVA